MNKYWPLLFAGGLLITTPMLAQSDNLSLPKSVAAGSAFSVPTSGSGPGVLYIAGPGGAYRHSVQLGEAASIPAGTLNNAGDYTVAVTGGSSTQTGLLTVTPASQPASLSFIAKPSRLPVGLRGGVSGAVYVFDAYHNLIMAPRPVSFQLSGNGGPSQTRTVTTHYGAAATELDSAAKEGAAQFVARAGDVSSTRIIEEVPGDPCGLHMSARPDGNKIELQTEPLLDCSGNPVPDGTIVTFSESYNGGQTTVDAPLKRGVAQAEVPAYPGARISVATGVVMGNEIRWEGKAE